jgi:hypothetical protein
MNQKPLTAIEVQVSLTWITIAEIILTMVAIFLIYFIIQKQLAK